LLGCRSENGGGKFASRFGRASIAFGALLGFDDSIPSLAGWIQGIPFERNDADHIKRKRLKSANA